VRRIRALLAKELADLRQHLTLFVPVALVAALAMFIPVFIAVIIPRLTNERLSDSSDIQIAVEIYKQQPMARTLDPEGAVQAFVFQTFLVFLVLVPVMAAMSIAAFSVVGEKQARSLEPLLATPISTTELLSAKVLAAFLPSLAITLACQAVYVLVVAVVAREGVFWLLLSPRSLTIVTVLAPLAALAALQMAVCVSSRVNDVRTAQQASALVILPVTGLFVGQILGAVVLTAPLILAIAAGLAVVNAGLMWLAVVLFDREAILTRWR
jgi:ABC-2 type transport system permease protein